MHSNYLSAVNAYQQAASSALKGGVASSDVVGSSNAGKFSGLVQDSISSTVGTMRQAEATAQNAMIGQASLDELVTSVANMEMSVKTVVAVRDRIISAYQDITKMPI